MYLDVYLYSMHVSINLPSGSIAPASCEKNELSKIMTEPILDSWLSTFVSMHHSLANIVALGCIFLVFFILWLITVFHVIKPIHNVSLSCSVHLLTIVVMLWVHIVRVCHRQKNHHHYMTLLTKWQISINDSFYTVLHKPR